MSLIFISHAEADREIANLLADWLKKFDPEIDTFVSSRPGDIRADEEWLPSIENALRKADKYIILLTHNSAPRPWVNFEAGAAWYSKKSCVLASIGLELNEIPKPLREIKQINRLGEEQEAKAIFEALLSQKPTDLDEFISELASQSNQINLAGENEPAWEGVICQGVFYTWKGPLLGLQDMSPDICPKPLQDILRQGGMIPHCVNENNISNHINKGSSLLYATDKKTYRRRVVVGKQLVMVRPEFFKQ